MSTFRLDTNIQIKGLWGRLHKKCRTYNLGLVLSLLFVCLSIIATTARGETHRFKEDQILKVKISKSGLNRISNPPYKIVQVTGDDSKFRIKYDEDGTNIYFMPISKVGEFCEISIKNNAGLVQDLELEVSNIKGKSIIIDSKTTSKLEYLELSNISQMLRAMRDNAEDKFYVQAHKQKLDNIGSLKVMQQKIYKYKNLVGGVFEIKNPGKKAVQLNLSEFTKRFDNVKASYADKQIIPPKAISRVLIVQRVEGSK